VSSSRPELRPQAGRLREAPRIEALTVAMALAPGVYVRNRMFDFFRQGSVKRARTRAAVLRGIIPQLARATGVTLSCDGEPRSPAGEPAWVLRYRIASMRMTRVVELTPTELAALRMMATRAGVAALQADAGDRARIDAALARLLDTHDAASDLAHAAQEAARVDQS
jgi:hypothetical protein